MEQGSFLELLELSAPPTVNPFARLAEDNLDRAAIRERLLGLNKERMMNERNADAGRLAQSESCF